MKNQNTENCRLNKVGGQAVLEGVMMKAGNKTTTTCRKPDGTLAVTDAEFNSVRKKHKILDLPIIRGVVNFIELLAMSMKTLTASAESLGIEEEETKFEKWLKEKLGVKAMDFIMGISLVLGLGLSALLFIFLPTAITEGINWIFGLLNWPQMADAVKAVIEGFVKVGIFLGYLSLVSLMPEIKRTFMYHGAEHKSIACFEAGDELTPENAMKHKRFHPRCGTSFMALMIFIGILAGILLRLVPAIADNALIYILVRIAILPLIVGIGYEIIMFVGKHDNAFTRIISAPGLWVQRITTKEPTLDMLEVAIVSLKCALRDEFSEFAEFHANRAWEKKEDRDPLADNDTAEFCEIAEGMDDDDAEETADAVADMPFHDDGTLTEASDAESSLNEAPGGEAVPDEENA